MKVTKICASYPVTLYVTGENIEKACQWFCDTYGLCVTITETNYIFSGGSEKGFIIGLINYPRFPKSETELLNIAGNLGRHLIAHCNPKGSFTIESKDLTVFHSNREGD